MQPVAMPKQSLLMLMHLLHLSLQPVVNLALNLLMLMQKKQMLRQLPPEHRQSLYVPHQKMM
jgi:hypothetical protein